MVEVSPGWTPAAARTALGDGSFGGVYQRPDEDMAQLWEAAVAELRALLEGSFSD
jgi:creatinine amidohydrolase